MNFSRLAAAGFATVIVGAALPSIASAEDYCVAPNYGCGANNVQKLQDALDLAASTKDADRVLLGAGTYVAPSGPFGFTYASASPVEIVGAGRGQTILTADQFATDRVLYLAGLSSSVRDLTIRIPAKVGPDFRGLLVAQSTARRLDIVADDAQVSPIRGVYLTSSGTLEDSSISLDPAKSTTGVVVYGQGNAGERATFRGLTIAARTGIDTGGFTTVDRSRVTAGEVALVARGPNIDVRNSLLHQTGPYGTMLKAVTQAGRDTTLTADGLTLIGSGTQDVSGIAATTADATSQSIDVRVANSVIRGAANAIGTGALGSGTAKVSSSYSDYDASNNVAFGGSIDEDHLTNVGDAQFADPANGDYRLRAGSPLVDRGDPDAPQGLDLDGNPLVADGNGDGFARRDIGAFELQPPAAPQPQGDTAAPVISGFRARRARVSYALSENARIVLKVQRRLAGKHARYRTIGKAAGNATQGPNRLRLARRIRAKDARPGRYRAVIVATDAAGNHSKPKAATFRVKR